MNLSRDELVIRLLEAMLRGTSVSDVPDTRDWAHGITTRLADVAFELADIVIERTSNKEPTT